MDWNEIIAGATVATAVIMAAGYYRDVSKGRLSFDTPEVRFFTSYLEFEFFVYNPTQHYFFIESIKIIAPSKVLLSEGTDVNTVGFVMPKVPAHRKVKVGMRLGPDEKKYMRAYLSLPLKSPSVSLILQVASRRSSASFLKRHTLKYKLTDPAMMQKEPKAIHAD